MDEKYEKLYSYGKSLTQDLQAVQDHLYQALCQSEVEKAAEAKRFEEEISRLKQQLVDLRTISDREIQRLNDLLEQEKLDAQTLTQKVDEQVTDLQNNVIRVVGYQNFLAEQQAKIEQQERVLKDKKEELDKREESIEKGEEDLKNAKNELKEKNRKFEDKDKSKRELQDQIHQLEVDNKKKKEELTKLNDDLNVKYQECNNLKTEKENLETTYENRLRIKDAEIAKLKNTLATYKHPGETENKIESNRIPIGGIDYPMQDDSDK